MTARPGGERVTQTHTEKIEAIRSLLPLITAHLEKHPGYRIVPRAQWLSEGERPPAYVPPPPCDERCLHCEQRCADESWMRTYQHLRRAYPVIKRLERLVELQILYLPNGQRMKTALRYTYLEPWDAISDDPEWDEWERRAVWWLAENCRWDVPMYEGNMLVRPKHLHQRTIEQTDRDHSIMDLRIAGLSYSAICSKLRCSKSTVRAVLAGVRVLHGRIVDG